MRPTESTCTLPVEYYASVILPFSQAISTLVVLTPRSLFALLTIAFVAISAVAEATTYQIRSRTTARATQFLRADRTLAAPRIWSQALTLAAYDLGADGRERFNARVSLRYDTDFALAQRLRQDPLFDDRFNDLTLDIAFLQWRPHPTVEIVAGRQWQYSPLGMVDIDGVSAAWQSDQGQWRPFARIAAGRDVQRRLTPFDPGTWDVQGLPPNDAALADDLRHLLAAVSAGITEPGRHRLEIAAREYRRPRYDDPSQTATTRRFGVSTSLSPLRALTVTATTSYHSTANGLDRAHLNAALRRGDAVITAGVDHRQPVFDTHSIFNLFGAQPYRSAYATYRHRLGERAGSLELRAWARAYFGDLSATETPHPFVAGDARAVGAALGGDHRISLGLPLQLYWNLSGQTRSGDTGGEQFLANLHLRLPTFVNHLFLTGRLLGLWARSAHHRRESGHATTAALGAELALDGLGRLSTTIESRGGSFAPANAALFALFEVEAWR